jgi:hypothetical protein
MLSIAELTQTKFFRRLLLPAVLTALAVVGCSPLVASGPVRNSYRVQLNDQHPEERRVGKLLYRGGLALTDANSDFGGLSGLEVDPDGRRFVAISDRGRVVTGALDYDDAGDLTAARGIKVVRLLDTDGKRVKGNRSDSEGLARLPDGRWAVSFERWHRIELYDVNPAGPAAPPLPRLPRPPGIQNADGNSGLEVVAALPDGRLLTIEEGQEDTRPRRAWLGGAEGWTSLTYRSKPPYRPTDATLLPSGDMAVLERRASILGGFGTRVVLVKGTDVRPGAELSGTELAVLEPPLITDNFEGISAVRRPDGSVMIYLVSDDNYWGLQRTLLLMFELAG